MTTAHKATWLAAYERLAARDTGGGEADHELESERERLLEAGESPGLAKRLNFERLYRLADQAGGYRMRALLVLAVLAALGVALAVLAALLGGFAV